jgi:anti-sigma factor RsiW
MVKKDATMNCDEAQELLEAFHDGELTPETRSTVAAHVKTCARCADTLTQLDQLSGAVKSIGRFPAPETLRRNVGKLATADRAPAAPQRRFGYGALAASHIGIALAGGLLGYAVLGESMSRTFDTQDIVSAHMRALMSGQPVQVTSTDTHTVRPWFAGKLDFTPDTRSIEGFPLIGARIDYVGGRNVAALVYGHDKHVIDVFVSPAATLDRLAPRQTGKNGYTIIEWRAGDLRYRAISDLDARELHDFVQKLEAR